MTIQPDEFLIVYLSGRDVVDAIDHWESPVLESNNWRYTIPTSGTSADWTDKDFNDTAWDIGVGGIGYDDDDDATEIAGPVTSLFMRTTFNVVDTSEIQAAAFHIDYDDGFIAYINGNEIARGNMSSSDYDDLADSPREATMISGGDPEEFILEGNLFRSYLVNGTNVLTIQVHNTSSTSTDMSSRPFLSIGLNVPTVYWNPVPSFYTPEVGTTYLHTNFSLNNGKEGVLLFNPQGTPVDGINPPEILSNMSYGRQTDGGNIFKMFLPSTPGTSNNGSTSYDGIWEDEITFNLPAGFYSNDQSVGITAGNAQTVIRYTTDGSKPTSTSSVYTNVISINKTTSLRAGAFRPGYISQTIETNTYIIGDTNNPKLPVMSISTDPDGFFSDASGIYELGPNASGIQPNYGANFWQDWEREIHIEYFDEQDALGIEQTCGVKIFGGWSRDQDMKSLRLMAKEEYGDNDFDYPFFKSKNINSFKQLVLRNSGNDFNDTHFRDALNHQTIKDITELDIMAYQPVVVFLNGEYWGIHNLRERINDHYIEDNHGVDNNKIDLIELGGAKYGTITDWLTTTEFVSNADLTNQTNYDQVKEMLDIPNVIDFFCSQTYHINWDSPHNNVRMWRPQDKSLGWRYLYYDTDFGLNLFGGYAGRTAPDYNELGRVIEDDRSTHSFMLKNLLTNAEFKCQFANRYADLMNTVYKASNYNAVADSIQALLLSDIDDHFDRWGNSMSGWNNNISDVKSFINDREDEAKAYLKSELGGLGADRTLTLDINPEGAGHIIINTVSPVSYSWSGDYFGGCPVNVTIKPSIGYEFSNWSGLSNSSNESVSLNLNSNGTITANFNVDNTPDLIAINEINYNSPSDTLTTGDWLELFNYGTEDVDLSGWTLKDANDFNGYSFPQGTTLKKGEYIVVAVDLVTFNLIHPNVLNAVGPLGFKLSNSGEEIRLYDGYDRFYSTITYNNKAPWSEIADGKGGTLELIDPNGDLTDPNNWFGGCLGGSPGKKHIECPCEGPFLGEDKFLCETGGSITLNTGLTLQADNEFTWYLNGDKLTDITPSITATVEGNYSVLLQSPNCLKESSVNVLNNISVDLGPDFNLCTPTSATLMSGSLQSNTTYNWFKNNINLNVSSPSLDVSTEGTYRLEVKRGLCSKVSNTVIVSSSSPTPNDVIKCGGGNVTLSVAGNSSYKWYNSEVGGSSIKSGNNYSTSVSQTTTYYVEDDTYFGLEAGASDPSFGDTWSQDDFEDYKARFYIYEDCYLNYVTVYPRGASTITIRITTGVNTGVIHEVTVPAESGAQRVYLGKFLSAGSYYMDAVGTDGPLTMTNENASYPYADSEGYMAVTRMEPYWASDINEWYFFFYNFEIANSPVQEKCDRTPVTAYTCESPIVNVMTNSSSVKAGERVEFSAAISGEYNLISWDFGMEASPRYASGVGPHSIIYNERGQYDVTVTVSNNIDNYTTVESNIVTVCSKPNTITLVSDAVEYCGTAVNLTATSVNGFEYTWYMDNVMISPSTLDDNTEQVMDIANYHVVVADPYNTDLCNTSSNIVHVSNCILSTTFETQKGLGMFPNPASNFISFSGVNGTVEIRDTKGLLLMTSSTTELDLDISSLKQGIYIVHVKSLDEDHLFRLVKE